MDDLPQWLDLAREIQAIAQTGLTYTQNDYDVQRYKRLMELSAEITAHYTSLDKEPILERFSIQSGYATPKIDVRGAMVRDGRILLVQEKVDGNWSMPGGWADVGDLPSAMVEREIREESGLKAKAEKIIAVYDANRMSPPELFHAYKIIFLCTILDGEPAPGDETTAVDFFDPAHLPTLSSVRTNERMIHEVFAHVADPGRATAFD